MRGIAHVVVLAIALIGGCIPTPTVPDNSITLRVPGGVFVLCEGLWQQDNASLSYINPTGTVQRSVVASLGDTPTDIVQMGDTLIVCSNTTRELLQIDRPTGTVLRRVRIGDREQPYRMAIHGRQLYVTCLNADAVIEFDAGTLERNTQNVPVGPAPEGVGVTPTKVYVAVSGLGDLRKNESGAGTLKILRRSDLTEVATISDLPNAAAVAADAQRQRIWVTYRQAPSDTAKGGVVVIHGRGDTIMHRFSLRTPTDLTIDPATGDAYVLSDDGVVRCSDDGTMKLVVPRTGPDVWYSVWMRPSTGELYVGNARQYVTDGEVLVYSLNGDLLRRSPVGLNPSAFAE